MVQNYDKNINKTSKISKLTKIKNPRKHLVYTDFLMVFLSIFIGLYLTSSKIIWIENQQDTATCRKYIPIF